MSAAFTLDTYTRREELPSGVLAVPPPIWRLRMRIPEGSPNRLGIFFFYDAQGVVDRYVEVLLADMVKNLSELTIVVNGRLTPEGRSRLEAFTRTIIVRENTGLDVWAYKTAMEHHGWDKLSTFDEIILFNATIMGPVRPFAEMFDEMNARDLDFWGMNWFHRVDGDPFGMAPEGYLPRHLQSHFHAYRKSLVSSQVFQSYWDTMPEIHSYTESIGYHESQFTQRFERLGFRSDVYVNTQEYEGRTYYPLMFYPRDLIENKKCPVFKRRSFFHDYFDTMTQSVGSATRELYDYLRDETDFDTDLIWENALRTMHMADIQHSLNLTYVLPTKAVEKEPAPMRIALIAHLYYMDLLEETLTYIRSMPQGCDIILTAGSDEKVATIKNAVKDMPYRVDVRKIENRGRDVSALLVGAGDVVMDYDLVCFVHDKKVTQLSPYSKGDGFALKCFDNLLASTDFVLNVIAEFQREPRMGALMPPPPNHAEYFPGYSMSWGPNYEITVDFLKSLGIRVPISPDKEPVSPLGTMFWFRPKALAPLLEREWAYEDFPPEPNAIDGTFLHAVERAYGYVAQSSGYFCAWLLSDRFARTELTNLSFALQEMTKAVSSTVPRDTLHGMVQWIKGTPPRMKLMKEAIRPLVPRSLQSPLGRAYRAVRKRLR